MTHCCLENHNEVTTRESFPYNPGLLLKFRCHLNVEICSSIKAVKYLYKYTYKGHDRATLEFQHDEVNQFIDARYVGPPEGVWRLVFFPTHDKSHNVERLAVHLKGWETKIFESGQERKAVDTATKTTLTACLTA